MSAVWVSVAAGWAVSGCRGPTRDRTVNLVVLGPGRALRLCETKQKLGAWLLTNNSPGFRKISIPILLAADEMHLNARQFRSQV